MNLTRKFLFTTLGIAVIAFLASANGPLSFWPEANDHAEPTAGQLPFFMFLGAMEAVAFGFGVAYWFFGRGISRRMFGSGTLGTAAHLAVGFLTANWWVHSNWHMINGMNLGGLLLIEYVFHVPLMIAGAVIALAGAMRASREPVVEGVVA